MGLPAPARVADGARPAPGLFLGPGQGAEVLHVRGLAAARLHGPGRAPRPGMGLAARALPEPVRRRARRGRCAGESTPFYLYHPTPGVGWPSTTRYAPLVALLRDRSTGAYSNSMHLSIDGLERGRHRRGRRQSRQRVDAGSAPFWRCTTRLGIYGRQVADLLDHFPPASSCSCCGTRGSSTATETLDRVSAFLASRPPGTEGAGRQLPPVSSRRSAGPDARGQLIRVSGEQVQFLPPARVTKVSQPLIAHLAQERHHGCAGSTPQRRPSCSPAPARTSTCSSGSPALVRQVEGYRDGGSFVSRRNAVRCRLVVDR